MEQENYDYLLDQRLTALEAKMESFIESITQDNHHLLLEQRLAALEAKMESLTNLVESFSSLPKQVDQLSNLESLVDRLQENFSIISDIDTFAHLRDLLAEGNFKAADQETASILFGAINKTADTITPSDIETFPVAPIRIVDRLWRKYSGDRFGLSIQLNIYRDLGGNLNTLIAQDEELIFAFCDRIGWRQNGQFIIQDDWDANLSSPEGFLPRSWWRTPYGLKIGNFILARLIKSGF